VRALAAGGIALALVILAPVLLLGALTTGVTLAVSNASASIDPARLPPLAAQLLGQITTITQTTCPELPPIWVVAEVDAESGWDPTAFRPDPNGGSAGLYQLNQANWIDAGGQPWNSTPPGPDSDILQPAEHLQRAIPWVCRNLRQVTAHLAATGSKTDPLDAMLVCHIAGCSRVIRSPAGIPRAGEADCDASCADRISTYIAHVHASLDRFSRTSGTGAPIGDLPAPTPFSGPDSGCTQPDPTSKGCLTAATRHALDQVYAAFGRPGPGSPIHSAGCWDPHAWNPTSDHSKGRACDFFPGSAGKFAAGAELANGWRLASWLRANASQLQVKYVIWQGRIWSPSTPDQDGWGKPYDGGGVYDPKDVTGGHFDHVHLSVR
jgi:hypothetical protein